MAEVSHSLIVWWPVLNARVQVAFQAAFQTPKIPEPELAPGGDETGNPTERTSQMKFPHPRSSQSRNTSRDFDRIRLERGLGMNLLQAC